MTSFYGYCPICHAPGALRERRPNGNDICQNNHSYPSTTALEFVPVDFIPVTPVDLEYENDLLRNDLNVLQKELAALKAAAGLVVKACHAADADGELDDRIDGEMLFKLARLCGEE